MTTLFSNVTEIQSNVGKEIDNLCMRVKKCEIQGDKNSKEIKDLEKKFTTELSKSNIKEEEKIPYVFSAPPQNCFFTGRTEEIQELKRILNVQETLNEKKVRVAAVCGLGGIGKTSLVSEYAHRMKDFYKGGVYWFSAEDDKFLDKTVNDIALKIGALLGSFDLNLSNILRKIGSLNEPSLIILDCVDQLELSSNMMKFLSFPSRENIFGHFVILTRRNPNLLVNEVSVFEEISGLQLKCFQTQEAKQFLFSRTGVNRDENVESVAECLCEELGGLPLALEQAGACIKMLRCSLSSYLEQYKAERLRLLSQQPARPVSPGNESSARLAVHTTWLINMEYMKKNPNGQAAIRFMNACSFFNGDEIKEELINVGKPEVEDVAYRECVSSPLGCHQVLKLLTDFSLFTYVEAHSVSTHRLVQELVRESFNPKSKAESFTDAVRMVSYAFSKCSSPSNLVSSDKGSGEEQNISMTALPNSSSEFYMWSKLCMHAHHLRREMEDLLVTVDSVRFPETSKILYECAVHLSANHKQEDAKRTLNFAYRMLDWLPLAKYKTVKKNVSNNCLFPLSIPLPKPIQTVIKGCCMAPFASVQCLTGAPDPEASISKLEKKVESFKLDGDKSLKEGRYKEALNVYSSAIRLTQDCNNLFDPSLLTNRATVYIKLMRYEDALKDANDYITRRPECWKGYARKALALHGLNEKVSAKIAAALAFYHNRAIFSDFSPFKKSFVTLQKRIFICDSIDELQGAVLSQEVESCGLKILVLGSKEYIMNSDTVEEPWNNCVLVGTSNDCAVSLKSDYVIPLLKCMLTNLSFYLNNSQLRCLPGSSVKALNCNFITNCYDDEVDAVRTDGDFNAEQCNFTSSNGCGLACGGPSNAVVDGCSFCNNGENGLVVYDGATLIVKSSRMCNNGFNGLSMINNKTRTSKVVAINCDFYNNNDTGIFVLNSKNVKLIRNSVFRNDVSGISMVDSEVDVRENNVFDNGLWGIWSQGNSWCNISMNKVFRNKAGGVRVGYRAEKSSPCVIEVNKIYDNIGPGFVENILHLSEVHGSDLGIIEQLRYLTYLKFPRYLTPAKFQLNETYNNKENKNVSKLSLSVPYCSNCRKKCELKMCEKCFTSAYCGKSCEKEHLLKHEGTCKVLREKSSYLITSMEKPQSCDYVPEEIIKSREKIRSKFKRRQLSSSFVVKVRTVLTMEKSCRLMLYNSSFQLHTTFDSKVITELVEEFGVLCDIKGMEKKLFFYCLFEKKGQLRIFTNEFPEFQSW